MRVNRLLQVARQKFQCPVEERVMASLDLKSPYGFSLHIIFYPKWAKVEDTSGQRHQGRSCSRLPQGFDNEGDGASSAFLKGK
jgi:hypothetical protein